MDPILLSGLRFFFLLYCLNIQLQNSTLVSLSSVSLQIINQILYIKLSTVLTDFRSFLDYIKMKSGV